MREGSVELAVEGKRCGKGGTRKGQLPNSPLSFAPSPPPLSPTRPDEMYGDGTNLGVTSHIESSPGRVDLETGERTDLDLHLE